MEKRDKFDLLAPDDLVMHLFKTHQLHSIIHVYTIALTVDTKNMIKEVELR